MSKELENLNRRAFLRGLMVTAGGLLVPKPLQVAVPPSPVLYADADSVFLDAAYERGRQAAVSMNWQITTAFPVPNKMSWELAKKLMSTQVFIAKVVEVPVVMLQPEPRPMET